MSAVLRAYCIPLSVALFLAASPAAAQKGKVSELAAVKAANEAFYAGLSRRDIAAIQKVWSSDADIHNIGPRSKVGDVGWEAQKASYERTFDAFPELKVSMPEPKIRINGSTAWVTGIEHAERKTKKGERVKGMNLGTSVFVKQAGHWRMVHHHASAIPQ